MIAFLVRAINLSATLLFGSTGEILIEKSGHLNLGIPGVMCFSAATGCIAEYYYVNSVANPSALLIILIPFIAAAAGGAFMGLIYSFLTVTLRANQNVVGLALTTFGSGASLFFVTPLKGEMGNVLPAATKAIRQGLPFAESLGGFGKLFLSYGIYVYFAIAIAIVMHIVLKRTRVGLHLRAVGENPATADATGINVSAYRYWATIIGSAIAGLGGMFFILDFQGGRWEDQIAVFGWLAVALVIFVQWRPALAILGSMVFAGLYTVSGFISVDPTAKYLVAMVPYVVTIIVLIITSIVGNKSVQPPAALGTNYFREER